MTRTPDRSVKMNFLVTIACLLFNSAASKGDGEINLNLEPLAPLYPREMPRPGAQLLGEGKWHETLGFTPT
jgi:hypothetical protein